MILLPGGGLVGDTGINVLVVADNGKVIVNETGVIVSADVGIVVEAAVEHPITSPLKATTIKKRFFTVAVLSCLYKLENVLMEIRAKDSKLEYVD